MMSGVSRNLGKTDAPPAARAGRPGWRDPRLWIGVALVAASVLAGARLLGGADRTIEVWAASGDLAAGQPVSEDDLVARRVRFAEGGDAERYLRVGQELPDDATLGRAVGAGELVPSGALGAAGAGLLEVPIRTETIAPNVEAGSVVDVWVTPADRAGDAVVVLDDVVVVAVPREGEAFGPGSDRQVLVGVEDRDKAGIGPALAAAHDGRISITREG